MRYINLSYTDQYHLFVTNNGDGYVSSGSSTGHYWVNKWISNSTRADWISNSDGHCIGIFVDISNRLYCSMDQYHTVVRRWLDGISPTWTIVAGTNATCGATSTTLCNPRGIFVDINFDLYVADGGNHRIQLFRLGQSDGITVAGGAVSNTTITLHWPMAVLLDADKYLFILDYGNDRIVGSGPNGFRCIAGCSGWDSAVHQLHYPFSFSFDSYGNIYVPDSFNDRIEKFILSRNSCGK